ncbi:MAG: tRNA (adenosine(37)-N6)-threonylcarbamoyltransferase complex ATPase subunit type 1 TsaE [Planctomycetota bacterium]|nr:MAG: tRNA (adenosine(37)-N6)-threonylcarbamoyltransferase complex ATPase subunit type 1 TsaE [Planctomycetota bacterium]
MDKPSTGSNALTVTTESEEETLALGKTIGEAAAPGLWVAMTGVLGSGKTRLAKGIAEGLGVLDTEGVVSPTYTIAAEYSGRVTFRHFDAYRLSGAAEFEDAAGDALEDASAVTAVEWAERVSDALPKDRLEVAIEITGDTGRRFSITATGPGSKKMLSELKRRV